VTQPLWQFSAAELDRAYTDCSISPVEVLHACLERCTEVNPKLNALVLVDETGARSAAQASEQRMREGKRLSPLDGVPYSVKDNLFVGGMRATWGSQLYADFVAPVDDLPVARMRAAGAVMVGKTNTPELALASYTDNLLFGPTRNPWNTALTPGGSSGGAVASVAAGITPIAIGTDAGGSTRVPSSYTGIYGLRPSTGAVARLHGFLATAHDFQAIGLMARTPYDVRLVFSSVSGPDTRDAASLRYPHARNALFADQVRIRLCDRIGDEPVDPQVRTATRRAAEQFAALGCRVEEGAVPFDLEVLRELWGIISSVGAARIVARHEHWEARVGANILNIAKSAMSTSAVQYLTALDRLAEFRRDVVQRWQGFDVLLTPTSAALPWPIGESHPQSIDGRATNPRSAAIFSTWVNGAGLPGLNVPVARSAEGLPIGIQLVGTFGADEAILNLATRYAAHATPLGWPPIAND
jgi:aspartyl-tRNA(Asn)/glutamyl-tRNA(Gln) amidotransferase subunit A